MAALRVAGRRAASNPLCTKRIGGAALYAASNGEPLRAPPPALYRGDPPPFTSAGRWAALMALGGRTSSMLAARPASFLGAGAGAVSYNYKIPDLRLLGTGAGTVGDKTGEPLFLGTGGPFFPATGDKIAGPLFMGTGGGLCFPTAGDKIIAESLSLGTGGKIGGGPSFSATCDKIGKLLSLGTRAGFAGNSTTRLIRGGGLWSRQATVGLAARTVVLQPLPAPLSRSFYTLSHGAPRNDCFHSFWSLEKKIANLEHVISEGHKLSSTNMQELRELLETVIVEQKKLYNTISTSMSIKASMLRYFLKLVLFTMTSLLAAIGAEWYLSRSYSNYKNDFFEFVKSLLQHLLRDPEVKKDAEEYADMGGAAIRRQFNPFHHFMIWWNNGKEGGHVMTAAEFSDAIACFAFTVLTLLSTDGACTEGDLINQLVPLGFIVKESNIAMLKFLVDKGYLKREMKDGVLWYSCKGDAVKDCRTGLMKARIAKLVKRKGTLADFTG